MAFIITDSEKEFIQSFCDGSFPPEEFKHRHHLHLGWLYSRLYTPKDAIRKICADIQAFTQLHGAAGKFNHTLTILLTAIIYSRSDAQQNFKQWLEQNSDLNFHAIDIIRQFYSIQALQSEEAKKKFVWPDVADLPESLQKILDDYFA
jgi:hypothetical protein